MFQSYATVWCVRLCVCVNNTTKPKRNKMRWWCWRIKRRNKIKQQQQATILRLYLFLLQTKWTRSTYKRKNVNFFSSCCFCCCCIVFFKCLRCRLFYFTRCDFVCYLNKTEKKNKSRNNNNKQKTPSDSPDSFHSNCKHIYIFFLPLSLLYSSHQSEIWIQRKKQEEKEIKIRSGH